MIKIDEKNRPDAVEGDRLAHALVMLSDFKNLCESRPLDRRIAFVVGFMSAMSGYCCGAIGAEPVTQLLQELIDVAIPAAKAEREARGLRTHRG